VVERAPLVFDWHGKRVITASPPSAGGLLLAETLTMHPPRDLEALGYRSGAYLHLLAETFRSAQDDRLRFIGDPAFIKMDVEALLAPRRLAARRARISAERTLPQLSHEVEESGTSQLLVSDEAGNVALVVSSLNDMFGAQLMTESGVVLNDQLAAFTHPRVERNVRSRVKPNRARGGARPVASMCPTLLLEGDKPWLALGASGGTRIPTAIAQVLLAHVLFGRSATDAVADPRVQTPFGGGLRVEPGIDAALVTDLRKRGEVVARQQPDYSAVQLLLLPGTSARPLEGASDPRKGGVVVLR
jgi:gamma-glutamyltranspeptidase/glutathione hydrolase